MNHGENFPVKGIISLVICFCYIINIVIKSSFEKFLNIWGFTGTNK